MESRIQEAINYLAQNPGAPVATIAREFSVSRHRLRNRIKGHLPKKGLPASNTRLSGPEEKALCRYIDRLDQINLAVHVKFVTYTANYILLEKSSRLERATPGFQPAVRPN
jgi:transposase-like protein